MKVLKSGKKDGNYAKWGRGARLCKHGAASGLVLGVHGLHRRVRWERKEQDSACASQSVKLLEVRGGGWGGMWKRTGGSETGWVGPGDWLEPAAGVSAALCGEGQSSERPQTLQSCVRPHVRLHPAAGA